MRETCCSVVAIFTLSLSTMGAVFADEAGAGDDPSDSTPAAKPEPMPGEVSTPPAPAATECGPLSYTQADKDQHPGRSLRITGGMFVALGLATLIPGAATLGWAEHHDNDPSYSTNEINGVKGGGAAALGVGALSTIVGIPMIVKGVREGRTARERPPSVLTSLPQKRGCGALAGLAPPRTIP
jgi:hypothetical protein